MNNEINEKDAVNSGPQETPETEAPAQPDPAEATKAELNAAQAEIGEWKAALELAVKQRDEYLDSLRRAQADFQNYKRRNQTARADGYDDGAREIVTAMLPVIDNLERAIAAAEGQSPLLDGVKLTLKSMTDSLSRFGLEELPAEGCDFDPEIHHAVMREPGDEPDKILEVFQKGYRVKDRIIRYSMVKVSVEKD